MLLEGKLDTALAGIKMLMLFAERHLNLNGSSANPSGSTDTKSAARARRV
jgi:hypothetical protein